MPDTPAFTPVSRQQDGHSAFLFDVLTCNDAQAEDFYMMR